MSSASNHGWDFVKVGGVYQYKESFFIAMITILEDNSTDKMYDFKIEFGKNNSKSIKPGTVTTISHVKDFDGAYSGMMQIYKNAIYPLE